MRKRLNYVRTCFVSFICLLVSGCGGCDGELIECGDFKALTDTTIEIEVKRSFTGGWRAVASVGGWVVDSVVDAVSPSDRDAVTNEVIEAVTDGALDAAEKQALKLLFESHVSKYLYANAPLFCRSCEVNGTPEACKPEIHGVELSISDVKTIKRRGRVEKYRVYVQVSGGKIQCGECKGPNCIALDLDGGASGADDEVEVCDDELSAIVGEFASEEGEELEHELLEFLGNSGGIGVSYSHSE